MPKALWNREIIAETDDFEIVEGNVYFPPETVRREFLEPSAHHTHCGWKGDASYYHLVVNGKTNENAAWYYPEPYDKAAHIKGYIAFWKGVEIED